MSTFSNRFEGITGSAIRQIFAYLSDPDIISLAGGNPSPATFPAHEIAQIAAELLERKGDRVLQYGATRGVNEFIEYLQQENAAIMAAGDDIITTTGSSQGIDLAVRTYCDPGDIVLVEAPTFLGAMQTFRLAGAHVEPVTLEDDGVDIEDLERKIQEHHPKIFYTIPNFQNPSGITMSTEKRRAVRDMCRRYSVCVLEDDPYGRLRYDGEPLPSIQSFDDGTTVVQLNSYSKTISPGLRVGYAIGPKAAISRMELLKQGADVHTPNLNQEIVLEYLKRGLLEPHLEETCRLYRTQRDAMSETLEAYAPPGTSWLVPDGGLFIWVKLPAGMNADRIFSAAVENKVVFVPGPPFYPYGGHEDTLRLNFSMPDEEQVREGTRRLCEVVAQSAA